MSEGIRACFLGGARYTLPLDATSAKKFAALASLGEMCVIGFARGGRPRVFRQHARFYLLPELSWAPLRYAELLFGGALVALWCVVRRRCRILVAQSPYEASATAAAKLLARLLGLRVALIVESHGDFEASVFLQRRMLATALYRRMMRWAAAYSLRRADALRAVSGSTREQLARWSPGKDVHDFPAWTDIEVFLDAGPQPTAGATVLFAGAMTALKGVRELAQAFARVVTEVPEARLEIAGRAGDAIFFAEVSRFLEKNCPPESFHFLGLLPQANLARHMAEATVLVLPSLSEGLGRVVFEAMAAGTPVIASRVGGIPELVEDGVTGWLIPPGDVEALAGRLRWVLQNRAQAQEMGARGRVFAQSFFSAQKYVESYRSLFELAGRAGKEKRRGDEAVAVQSGHRRG